MAGVCPDKGQAEAAAAPAPSSKAIARSVQRQSVAVLSSLLVVAALLFVWSVDTSAVRSRLSPSVLQAQDYLPRIEAAAADESSYSQLLGDQTETPDSTSPNPGFSDSESNGSTSSTPGNACPSSWRPGWTWISAHSDGNYSTTLISRWLTPGGEPCRDGQTGGIAIPGLDGPAASPPVPLSVGDIHEFSIHALDEAGNRRCLGGDYFETDLSGDAWKSRPPVHDRGDGSYGLSLQVHPDFAGDYSLTVVLLFRGFEGLKFSPERFALKKELRIIRIRFYDPNNTTTSERNTNGCGPATPPPPLSLRLCSPVDFTRDAWSGRWTRHARNDSCSISEDGRYRCLRDQHPCTSPWCEGPLGALESNGWVYSAHCAFRLLTQGSAWECLRGKWIYFWGDSNHVDTIRNLVNFVLGQQPEIPSLPRRFDRTFYNPANASEWVRITNVFNGHWNESLNYLGLDSLQNDGFRSLLWRHFTEDGTPDVMVLNSGLHDGIHWMSIRAFVRGADRAAEFWADVFRHWRDKGKRLPKLFYRTTVATGGHARTMAFNPNKMEAFNGIMVEKMREKGLLDAGGIIDGFDMSFPWHWDNRCNDGVHYGRAPAKARWRDGEIGHYYFVDLMLVHVLLNAMCPSAAG